MKLKVPINKNERKFEDYAPFSASVAKGWNACLDEVSQCEVCFDELELAKAIFEYQHSDGIWNLNEKLFRECLDKARSLIAAMPSIMTIKRNENDT